MTSNVKTKTYKTTFKYAVVAFIVLLLIEVIQIYNDINDYKTSVYNQKKHT